MLNRSIAPPITDAVNFHLELKPYEKFTLDNGVPVYAINAGAEEVKHCFPLPRTRTERVG